MAEIPLSIEAPVALSADLGIREDRVFDRPEADLRRWQVAALQVEDAPTFKGYPELPKLWVRCKPVLSATGEYIDGRRPDPEDVDLGSFVRWIPHPQSYDAETTGTFSPWLASSSAGYSFHNSDSLTRPQQTTLSYRLARELVNTPSLKFGATTNPSFLLSKFGTDSAYDHAVAFTFSMVVVLYPPLQEQGSYANYGIIGSQNNDKTTFLHYSDRIEYGWRDARGVVNTPISPAQYGAPVFITLAVSPPSVTCTVALGNRQFRSMAAATATASATSLEAVLGKPRSDYVNSVSEYPNFSLLDFSIFGKALNDEEITDLTMKYVGIYGSANA